VSFRRWAPQQEPAARGTTARRPRSRRASGPKARTRFSAPTCPQIVDEGGAATEGRGSPTKPTASDRPRLNARTGPRMRISATHGSFSGANAGRWRHRAGERPSTRSTRRTASRADARVHGRARAARRGSDWEKEPGEGGSRVRARRGAPGRRRPRAPAGCVCSLR
jgi:hypothetical protein